MATKFVPLEADLIDEGEFLVNLNEELRDIQTKVAQFRRLYGTKAKDAKAKLVIEVEFKVEEPDDDAYSVKTTMKATYPKRPSSVSFAMGGERDDGQLALFVRKSGSDETFPKQLKLATKDGRIINQETGEVIDNG